MRKIGVSVVLAFTLLIFMTCSFDLATAKNDLKVMKDEALRAFELQNGDRVVFLGNSLFENDLKYGYIEFVLTSRWPDRDIIFRNLGWMGDTVFGEARGYFTTPPDAYGHLMNQLTQSEPTVVFVAYGAIEAFEGEEGLERFTKGLNRLLDKVVELGAEAVLLSPLPEFQLHQPASIVADQNQNLEMYKDVIIDVARERGTKYIDLFTPLKKFENNRELTTNGIHLNETGYFQLARLIESGLNLTQRSWSAEIDLNTGIQQSAGVMISNLKRDQNRLQFEARDEFLPLPLPARNRLIADNRKLCITGLDDGRYTLKIDGVYVISATAGEWSEGVDIYYGSSFRQAERLQNRIIRKNYHFFLQYRPQNRTYLTGFRAYEQGQNAYELEQLDNFIQKEERHITRLRSPARNVYRLVKSR